MTTGETDLVTGNLGTGPVGQRGIRDQWQTKYVYAKSSHATTREAEQDTKEERKTGGQPQSFNQTRRHPLHWGKSE